MRTIASLSVGVLLLLWSLGPSSFLPDAAADDVAGCMQASLVTFVDPPIRGKAFLCPEPHGVRAELRVRALTPRNAYTIWFIYLDDPSQCATPECSALEDFALPGQCEGPLDLSGFTPVGVMGRLDSAVAPRDGK